MSIWTRGSRQRAQEAQEREPEVNHLVQCLRRVATWVARRRLILALPFVALLLGLSLYTSTATLEGLYSGPAELDTKTGGFGQQW